MAKRTSQYICQACGAVSAKWAGKCEACGEWNSMVEEVVESAAPKGITPRGGRRVDLVGLA
ncbi:MAG: DNA repair protein RadA, partial [Pseudomonadota bacterium]|nr:DNA repair protein RadA [Pseudomonadota bacterium]